MKQEQSWEKKLREAIHQGLPSLYCTNIDDEFVHCEELVASELEDFIKDLEQKVRTETIEECIKALPHFSTHNEWCAHEDTEELPCDCSVEQYNQAIVEAKDSILALNKSKETEK
ncbi:MAG: hypothetical protein WCJ81_09005 [bacterium]